MDGWVNRGVVSGWVGATPTHISTCMHVCTQTCMLNMINMDASMEVVTSNFNTYIFQCYVCACVCVWGGHVGAPSDTPTPTHTYTCKCWGPQITKNAIKLEQIEIIQFCLKIWNLCTFLHLYRLGLVCRWEGVPSQIAFFTFRPKTYISFAPVSLWV